ncbi:MAG TPA: response regulator transcription factor [Jatrophihabitans sp.]|nr:response regulator transcription factor [Jatrophihabitans sp.]
MRVLLCDDHAVFAEALEFFLVRAGYSVVQLAREPAEAIEVLGRQQVEVCVLDLRYGERPPAAGGEPGCSVLDLMPTLRAAAPAARFLLLTGYLDPGLVGSARAAGFTGIVNKGCHSQDIVAAIERVGRGEQVSMLTAAPRPEGGPARLTDAQRVALFLTQREREVLGHLVVGADTTTLARTMGVSWTTARSHVQSVLNKLGAHSRLEAATSAVRNGVVDGETGRWLL